MERQQPTLVPPPLINYSDSPRRPASRRSRVSALSDVTSNFNNASRRQTIAVDAMDSMETAKHKRQTQTHEPTHTNSQASWGSYVAQFLGNLAGKAWQFACDSAFRGFRAGGGDAYQLSPSAPPQRVRWRSSSPEIINKSAASVPGQFPIDDYELELELARYGGPKQESKFISYGSLNEDSDVADQRPSKRQQVTKGEDWVTASPYRRRRPRSPLRPLPSPPGSPRLRHSLPNTGVVRAPPMSSNPYAPALRLLELTNPSMHAQGASAASTRSQSPTPIQGAHEYFIQKYAEHEAKQLAEQKAIQSGKPSPTAVKDKAKRSHRRSTAASTPATPPTDEVRRYAAKRRREERKADESIEKLDRQMMEMIREGKDALATPIDDMLEDILMGVYDVNTYANVNTNPNPNPNDSDRDSGFGDDGDTQASFAGASRVNGLRARYH